MNRKSFCCRNQWPHFDVEWRLLGPVYPSGDIRALLVAPRLAVPRGRARRYPTSLLLVQAPREAGKEAAERELSSAGPSSFHSSLSSFLTDLHFRATLHPVASTGPASQALRLVHSCRYFLGSQCQESRNNLLAAVSSAWYGKGGPVGGLHGESHANREPTLTLLVIPEGAESHALEGRQKGSLGREGLRQRGK